MSIFNNNNDSEEVMSVETPESLKTTVRNAANLFGNYFSSKKPVKMVSSVTSTIANTSPADIKNGIKVVGLMGVSRVGKILNGIYHISPAKVVGVIVNPIADKVNAIRTSRSLIKEMKAAVKAQTAK